MNQQQFIETGKGKKVPANVLNWIWKNKDLILSLIIALFGKKVVQERLETDCQGVKPVGPPVGSGPNGEWFCMGGEWVWIEDIG